MKRFPVLILAVLVMSPAAFADTTFYQQNWDGGTTSNCDMNTSACGSTGWIVYDGLNVPGHINALTGFTYVDQIVLGSWSDYKSTNWFLFGPNAPNPFGAPVASGTAQGTLTDLGGGYMMIAVTGLNLALTPANNFGWILGFQNNMSQDSDITARAAGTPGDGIHWQTDNPKIDQVTYGGDTALSVIGSEIPEPSTLLMLGTGLIGGLGALRRKLI
ncbi:MAG: PEP-CTERM sorting domain-containing protein [Candidatus Korobacteraceae bacterium]